MFAKESKVQAANALRWSEKAKLMQKRQQEAKNELSQQARSFHFPHALARSLTQTRALTHARTHSLMHALALAPKQ